MTRQVAVRVGVEHTEISGFRDLKSVKHDAAVFESLLGDWTKDIERFDAETAKVNDVHDAIVSRHDQLIEGDRFVFAFSGHGHQRSKPESVEADGKAESLVLFNGFYRDDQLRSALHGFRPGVNVYAIIDACHAAGAVFLHTPRASSSTIPYRRGFRVSGATSLTLAAAGESDLAPVTADGRGQLADCLRRAWSGGAFDGTWGELWSAASSWALGLGYSPLPQAWLDGPDPSDDGPLRVRVRLD